MRPAGWDVAVFAGIVVLAAARLMTPFTGDQALNMLMGQVIAEGGTPYADLWDLKHPGVFFFFAAGGALFGFTEVGIRLFELLWMLALAGTVRAVAGQLLGSRLAVTLAPLLVVGSYYAGAGSLHLTQTEALVGLPLLLSLVAATAALRPGSRRPLVWLFASGLGAGVVAVFKAPYLALPVVFWLLALAQWRRERRGRALPSLPALAGAVIAGGVVPVAATLAYLVPRTGVDLLWWTFVVHPGEAAGQSVLEPQRLLAGTAWFVRTFGALLALAVVGGWARLRRGWEPLVAGLVAWVAVGLVLIWTQVISWWAYHYLLVLVPIGLLAAYGVEALGNALGGRLGRRGSRLVAPVALAGLAVLAAPLVAPGTQALAETVQDRPPALDSEAVRAHQAERDSGYADLLSTTAFLREPGSHAGPIYAFDSPVLYVLAGRPPAAPLLAPWFHPTSELWDRLMGDLEAASPAYIFVSDAALETIVGYNPALGPEVDALRAWVAGRYDQLRTDARGTWHVRSDLAARERKR